MNHILFIGAGRMAEAIISGIVQQDQSTISSITVANHSDANRLKELENRYGINAVTDWKSPLENVNIIILASPPDTHESLLTELSAYLNKQLVITVAAGIDPTFMEQQLPEGTPVCWIMPNTAAQVQKSMSTFVCGKNVTNEHRKIIIHLLKTFGTYEELTEEQVHNLTAITGSAPAFLYLFCEALEEAAVSYGISSAQARKLVTNMVAGSAAMLEAGYSPYELREQVTSPGGSTAAGLQVLNEHGYRDMLQAAVKATNEHARKNI
ncbi:pyrroline-5-carboxylate reductase [Anaerobacillus sp. MEB173]|uniref:pyrroline-5-carboxylate reductase n=1 Tax=Anaerobacillus sp. MEB173 TaxID=3383345 RepID=UPI003F8F7D0E